MGSGSDLGGAWQSGASPSPLLGGETGKDNNLNSLGWDTGLGYGGYAHGDEDLATKEQGLWQQYGQRGVDQSSVDPAQQAQMNASAAANAKSRQGQMGAAGLMWNQANGGDTPALMQARQSIQYGQNLQGAMMANAGGPQALAAARQNNAMSISQAPTANLNSMNALSAQERQNGLNAYSGMANQMRNSDLDVYGKQNDFAYQQAELEEQRRQASDAIGLGYSGMMNQYNVAQDSQLLGQGAQNLQLQQQQTANNNQMLSGAAGAGSGAAAGLAHLGDNSGGSYQDSYDGTIYHQDPYSDETKKTDVAHSGLMGSFLDTLANSRATYRYKDPSNEPRMMPTGGRYAGVMAQDLERVPEIGPQLIRNTPTGKRVEHGAMLSALSAGLGEVHARLRQLEGFRNHDE